jgi:2-keto-4-pentenoate hydratase/2-oxohepta-3-ene-1,7-dioic acid hydratase in catechol pathway
VRLVRYEAEGTAGVGVLTDDGVVPTGERDLLEALRQGVPLEPLGRPTGDYQLRTPIPRPGKILCCGVNYASHKEENPDAVLPSEPFFFSKLPSAVIGPDDPIVLPTPSSRVDYEVELAMVIGRRGRALRADTALDVVFGYTVLNDISARDVQFKDNQVTLGKGFDTFSPIGPCVVTADEIPDPQQLRVSTYVNGEVRQDEPTANMLFSAARLLEFVSRYITLEPGDIVTTGTPAGVGTFRTPPAFLAPGDVVEVRVDAIGRLRNPVQAGW